MLALLFLSFICFHIEFETRSVVMQCQPGDVVLMDGRTLHRGLANQSKETRPLCYFSFCAPWYKEWPRSQNEGRSLFDEYREHRQKARERRPAGRQSAESFFTS